MKMFKPFLFVACAFASAAALASGSAGLPQESVQGSVHFVSGGVGKDESDAMKQAEAQYPLAIEFSRKGEFVADINLTIEDKAGDTVLNTSSAGPFVLVKLPDGRYTVKAEERGERKVRQINVSAAKPARLVLSW